MSANSNREVFKTTAGVEIRVGDIVRLSAPLAFAGSVGVVERIDVRHLRGPIVVRAARYVDARPDEVTVMEWSHGHALNSAHGPGCDSSENVLREVVP